MKRLVLILISMLLLASCSVDWMGRNLYIESGLVEYKSWDVEEVARIVSGMGRTGDVVVENGVLDMDDIPEFSGLTTALKDLTDEKVITIKDVSSGFEESLALHGLLDPSDSVGLFPTINKALTGHYNREELTAYMKGRAGAEQGGAASNTIAVTATLLTNYVQAFIEGNLEDILPDEVNQMIDAVIDNIYEATQEPTTDMTVAEVIQVQMVSRFAHVIALSVKTLSSYDGGNILDVEYVDDLVNNLVSFSRFTYMMSSAGVDMIDLPSVDEILGVFDISEEMGDV